MQLQESSKQKSAAGATTPASRPLSRRAFLRLAPLTISAGMLLHGCGGDNTTVPDRPSVSSLLSAVIGDDGQVATFVSGILPSLGVGPSGTLIQNGAAVSSTTIAAGDTVEFALTTDAQLSALLIGVVGQSGYYDLPTTQSGAARSAGRAVNSYGFRLSIPSAVRLNSFILRIVPLQTDGTLGAPRDTTVQVAPPFVDQPPSPPFTAP